MTYYDCTVLNVQETPLRVFLKQNAFKYKRSDTTHVRADHNFTPGLASCGCKDLRDMQNCVSVNLGFSQGWPRRDVAHINSHSGTT